MFTLSELQKNSNLLLVLKQKWTEVHDQSCVFRYKINNIRERNTNETKYLLQLNPDRSSKRRTPENIDTIIQPFNSEKFNFNKVLNEEILFEIQQNVDAEKHTILVNVSPISKYHSLLCPSRSKCLPQIVTEESLELVIQLMFLVKDRSFRIGFNSLCALASVNHLHYHLFVEQTKLIVETAKCKHVYGPLFCLRDYPVPAFCFQIQNEEHISQAKDNIYKVIKYLLNNSIAHNIFFTRGSGFESDDEEVLRIIIWPRISSSGVKQLGAFNVAVCELSGWFPVYNVHDFERLESEELEGELKKWRIDNIDQLCCEIKKLFY